LQIQIFIVDLWINEKVMTALEASYVLACKYNMMAPANRKQLPAAVFIFAAVLVQK
jgi:hypothetical protein